MLTTPVNRVPNADNRYRKNTVIAANILRHRSVTVIVAVFNFSGIIELAKSLPYECASICSFCSRMKRGRMYTAARREGYNVLAIGQHLDDLAESFLMSFFHNGIMRTMKANYSVQ